MVKGTILNYRGSHKTHNPYQVLIKFEGIEDRKKEKSLVGKKATYKTSSGKLMQGEILAPHANKGVVRVRFEPGLPGQALGKQVEISK